MSISTIRQRIEDYSTVLTTTNSGLSSDLQKNFLNDGMLDGAKDVVNRLKMLDPLQIPKFCIELDMRKASISSDFAVTAVDSHVTYITAAVTDTTQNAWTLNDNSTVEVGDYITCMSPTNIDPLQGVEILKVAAIGGGGVISVIRSEFDSIPDTHSIPIAGTPSADNPRIFPIKRIVPLGDVVWAEFELMNGYGEVIRVPVKKMMPHLVGKYEDRHSLLFQTKQNAGYVEKNNKIFIYPSPDGESTAGGVGTGKVNVVSYGDIMDFTADLASNTRDNFPEEHLNQVIMFAGMKTFGKVMSYMKNRLLTFNLPAMNTLPDDVTLSSPSPIGSPEPVNPPTTDINITETLNNITFPDSFVLEELDVGNPATPAAIPTFSAQPVVDVPTDYDDTTTVATPGAVTFPPAPELPSMEALPSFPALGAIGTVTSEITAIEITIPPLQSIQVGDLPAEPDGLQTTFTPEWLLESISSYDGYTAWGHDETNSTAVPAAQWSFEHQMVVEEDPEMAALRLRQMEVEVDKFSKTQEVISRVYIAQVQAYGEKVRAEIAKISGEAQIAAEEARAKRTIMEAQASKVNAEASIVQSEVQANQALIQAYSSEVGAKVNKFSMETKAKTDAYVGEVRGLTQIYQTEAGFNVQKFNAEAQINLQVFLGNVKKTLQKHTMDIQIWQADISSTLQRWQLEEWQTKIVKWQLESQVKIQEFTSKIGQNVQKYAQDIANENNKSAYEVRRYGAELQKLAQQNQMEMSKYQTEYQMKLQEWALIDKHNLQEWTGDLKNKFTKFQLELQRAMSVYQIDVQGSLQKHQMDVANLNMEYQWCGQQMQILTAQYNQSFMPYQKQQQQQQVPQQVVQGGR